MLVVLLILLTNVLADSDEDKYVDFLPEEEKQQFIEKVARRILKDVQSQEMRKDIQSGELSEEQLTKHNEFVKSILKQEADYTKRRKNEPAKTADDKSTSEEQDTLGVKPLESEKLAIADDTDLERLDLTLRHDRREIAVINENSTDYIKVETVTDPAPKIKRSVPTKTGSESSESDEFTSEEKIESKTEKNIEVVITTEKYENLKSTIANNDIVTTTQTVESTTTVTNSNHTNIEIVVPVKHGSNITEIKSNISKNEETNSSKKIESTTLDKEGIGQEEPQNYSSSESEEEELQVKGISEQTRRYNENSNETLITTTKSDTVDNKTENIDVESVENKTESNKFTTVDTEELTTVTHNDYITTDNIPTIINVAITDSSSSTNTTEDTERELDTTTEYPSNTLTSTLTDEGTTDSITETSSYSSSTEVVTTETSKNITTTTSESTSNTGTEICCKEQNIAVKHYTWEPVNTSVDSVTPISLVKKESSISNSKPPSQTKMNETNKHATKDITTQKILLEDEDSMEPTTKKNKLKPRIHKVETVIKLPKNIHDTAIVAEKKTKQVKNNLSVDKHFIELEKVYYDNNYKVKLGNKYEVYELPADKTPFIEEEQVMTEQPYYVPIYNYAPDNAYFNPLNRLGPNPEDVSLDDIGAFSVVEESNSDQEFNDKVKAKNYDIEDSGFAYDIKRKKFGSKQTVPHSIHKTPHQNDSFEKKRGHVNSKEYLDSDYYFGRVRKEFERRDNNFDQFPNSNEHDHPTHSIHEMSLKDHVRAVRNILFQQKKFGPPVRSGIEQILRKKESIRKKPNKLLIKKADSITRNGNNYITNKEENIKDNNIAIDYYFGRVRPTAIFTSDIDKAADKHLQKVGYIQNQNNTKELYVIDEFFKDKVLKYLTEIQTKSDTYVKADLMAATPHPITLLDSVPLKQIRNETVTRFRIEEMKRNAEIMKNFMKNLTENKNVNDEFEKKIFIKMRSEDKKHTFKDKIGAVRKKVMNNKSNSTTNHEMNLRLNRRNDVVKVGVYIQVLKDMISLDNKALKQYDWLGTSVDIQGSLQKLSDLIYLVADEDTVHPGDLEILKYVLFLHKLATEIIEANDFGSLLRKKLALPRNKNKEKHRMLKEKGLINRVWLYLRREVNNEDTALTNLNQFLMDIEDGLFNLHDAIKNIAKITKFKNQHWYQNLKELYLNTDEKHVLELLLHMTVSRLFDLVENSARSGLEYDYVKYMKRNKKIAKRTLEEMLFAIQILEEINKIVD